ADDVGALGVRAREADRGLDRFGAAAEELCPRQLAGGEIRDEADQLRARPRGEAADSHGLELRGQRGDVPRMTMTKAGDGDAGVQIEIAVPVEAHGRGAAAPPAREPRPE